MSGKDHTSIIKTLLTKVIKRTRGGTFFQTVIFLAKLIKDWDKCILCISDTVRHYQQN